MCIQKGQESQDFTRMWDMKQKATDEQTKQHTNQKNKLTDKTTEWSSLEGVGLGRTEKVKGSNTR